MRKWGIRSYQGPGNSHLFGTALGVVTGYGVQLASGEPGAKEFRLPLVGIARR
jgi:hypothetical protein